MNSEELPEAAGMEEQQPQQAPTKVVVLNDDDNDFDSMNIRPEALFLRGVDELSPRNIKVYIDHYIRPDYSFTTKEKYEDLNYKIEWINDSSLNIVFLNKESALVLLAGLSVVPLGEIPDTEERKAQEYINEEGEDKHPDLYIRQSFSYDKKVKNARVYSRYYLLHGEPEKIERPLHKDYYNNFKKSKSKYRERDERPRGRDDEPDLFTGEIVATTAEPDRDVRPLKDRIGIRDTRDHRHGRHGNRGRGRGNSRRRADEEEDLFPQLLGARNRDRSLSPSRDDSMEIDDN